jgi:hypothetical protein
MVQKRLLRLNETESAPAVVLSAQQGLTERALVYMIVQTP